MCVNGRREEMPTINQLVKKNRSKKTKKREAFVQKLLQEHQRNRTQP